MPTEFKTKAAARKAIAELGYTQHDGSGQCGDGAWGSREYYSRPGGPVNSFKIPTDTAQLDRLCGTWQATVNYRRI